MNATDLGTVLTPQETALALPAINAYLGITDAQISTPRGGNSELLTTGTVSPAQLTAIQNQITAHRATLTTKGNTLAAKFAAIKTTFNGRTLASLTAAEKNTLALNYILWEMTKQGWISNDGTTIQIP